MPAKNNKDSEFVLFFAALTFLLGVAIARDVRLAAVSSAGVATVAGMICISAKSLPSPSALRDLGSTLFLVIMLCSAVASTPTTLMVVVVVSTSVGVISAALAVKAFKRWKHR